MADVKFEREESENQLIEKALKFLQSGCGCSRGAKGGPCSKQFEEETVLHNLHNCIELTNAELDLVVLASIQAFLYLTNFLSNLMKKRRNYGNSSRQKLTLDAGLASLMGW